MRPPILLAPDEGAYWLGGVWIFWVRSINAKDTWVDVSERFFFGHFFAPMINVCCSSANRRTALLWGPRFCNAFLIFLDASSNVMPATPVGELHAELSSQYSFVRFAKLLAAIFFLLNLTFFGFTPIGTTFVPIDFDFITASDFLCGDFVVLQLAPLLSHFRIREEWYPLKTPHRRCLGHLFRDILSSPLNDFGLVRCFY